MGMFDNISVSDQLPFSEEMIALGLDKNNLTFQTKDLECVLETYIIQDRKLYRQCYKSEVYVEGDAKSKNWLGRLGHIERNDPYLSPVEHHGEVYFYEFIKDVNDKWDCWVEFKATFTKGNVDKIELFKFDKTDNTERRQREKQWLEETERLKNIWYNKYFCHTRPYRWFSHRVWYTTCYKLGNFFHKISHKL
jgi:hypothetical protein